MNLNLIKTSHKALVSFTGVVQVNQIKMQQNTKFDKK